MKGFKIYGLIATLAASAVCASAFAQDGPPPQGGQGGPPDMRQDRGPEGGQGMRGGPGHRMGPPPEPLIMRPDVQKELKLTDDQIKKLRPLFSRPARGADGQGGAGDKGPGGPPPNGDDRGGPPNGGQGGPPQDMGGPPNSGGQGGPPDRMDLGGPGRGQRGPGQMDEKIQAVLTETQFKRLKELRLQRMGAEALMGKEIADKIGLSDDERAHIRGIVESAHDAMPRPEQGQQPDREKMMKAHREMGAKINDEVFAVLTSSEKSKWSDLTGKPFKFDESYRPEPPQG